MPLPPNLVLVERLMPLLRANCLRGLNLLNKRSPVAVGRMTLLGQATAVITAGGSDDG